MRSVLLSLCPSLSDIEIHYQVFYFSEGHVYICAYDSYPVVILNF
jgi:hypothetical protein